MKMSTFGPLTRYRFKRVGVAVGAWILKASRIVAALVCFLVCFLVGGLVAPAMVAVVALAVVGWLLIPSDPKEKP